MMMTDKSTRLLMLLTLLIAGAAQAQPFDIPAGDAIETLKVWQHQSGLQLLFDFNAVLGERTRGVRGDMSPAQALEHMLALTGFRSKPVNDRTMAMVSQDTICKPWLGAMAPLPPCHQAQAYRL